MIESPFVLLVKTYERLRVGSNVIPGCQSIRKCIEGKQRIEKGIIPGLRGNGFVLGFQN